MESAGSVLLRLKPLLIGYGQLSPEAKKSARQQATQLGRETSIEDLVSGVALAAELSPEQLQAASPALASWLSPHWDRLAEGADAAQMADEAVLNAWRSLYLRLPSADVLRGQILRALARAAHPASLEMFVQLLIDHPPSASSPADQAFVPLFRRKDAAVAGLYPRLLAAMQHPQLATAVLDLANYLVHEGILDSHPGRDRVEQWIELLGGLVQHLSSLESRPNDYAHTPQELSDKVTHGVGLTIALCDALGLIGDERATGRLRQAMQLSHRRIKAEAAAALARAGDDEGLECLLELAAEPASRPQAIRYLAELGLEDKIDPQHRTAEAQAEGEFAAWLTNPAQFGLPPHKLEVVDRRQQYWPGFSEPVDCCLVRYEYRFPNGRLTGIGIAQPVIHAFQVDLEDLPPGDIYAMYAGWSADHASIREVPFEELSSDAQAHMQALADHLTQSGYTQVRPIKAGQFFGQEIYVFVARYEDRPGVVMVEAAQIHWLPSAGQQRPPGPHEAYQLLKGRKLLAAFNRED